MVLSVSMCFMYCKNIQLIEIVGMHLWLRDLLGESPEDFKSLGIAEISSYVLGCKPLKSFESLLAVVKECITSL